MQNVGDLGQTVKGGSGSGAAALKGHAEDKLLVVSVYTCAWVCARKRECLKGIMMTLKGQEDKCSW